MRKISIYIAAIIMVAIILCENGYYDDDYISPVEAFEGNEDLYNEWLLNS